MEISPRPLALYIRIREKLMREIAAGHWKDGERFPAEQELSQSLQVAVGTLRKAVAGLVELGYLVRRQGSGTYVSRPERVSAANKSVYEFFHLELRSGGGLPGAVMLALDRLPHPAAIPAFAGHKRSQCYRVRRLRLLDAVPVALEEIWFDSRHRRGLKAQDLGEALYHFYENRLGFWIANVADSVSAGPVPAWAPGNFPLQPGEVCGLVQRRAFAANAQLEEYSTTWFNQDTAHYSARWP